MPLASCIPLVCYRLNLLSLPSHNSPFTHIPNISVFYLLKHPQSYSEMARSDLGEQPNLGLASSALKQPHQCSWQMWHLWFDRELLHSQSACSWFSWQGPHLMQCAAAGRRPMRARFTLNFCCRWAVKEWIDFNQRPHPTTLSYKSVRFHTFHWALLYAISHAPSCHCWKWIPVQAGGDSCIGLTCSNTAYDNLFQTQPAFTTSGSSADHLSSYITSVRWSRRSLCCDIFCTSSERLAAAYYTINT